MNPAGPLTCPKCRRLMTPEEVATGARCPSCQVMTETLVFPAMFEGPRRARTGERLMEGDQAACFYHPTRQADTVCDLCGRFLCATCDLELFNQHVCPRCVEAARDTGRLGGLDNAITRWDKVALSITLWPLILWCLWWVWIITAPIALYICLRYRKARLSLVPVSRWRFTVAFVLAIVQLAGFIGLMTFYAVLFSEVLGNL